MRKDNSGQTIESNNIIHVPIRFRKILKGYDYACNSILYALKIKKSVIYTRIFLVAFIGIILKRRVILELHTDLNKSWQYMVMTKFLLSSKRFRLVVISEGLRSFLIKKGLPERENIYIIRSAANPVNIIRNRQASNQIRLGYIGSFYPGKGLEIVGELAPLMPDYEFNLIGGTEDEAAKLISVSENMVFHGYVPHQKIVNYIADLDILLLPILSNVQSSGGRNIGEFTSPLKLFEYMSTKIPIVASNIAVIREVLENNVNALLCDENNIPEWKNAIELLRDSNLSQRLTENAYKDFISNYTYDQRAKDIMNICLTFK